MHMSGQLLHVDVVVHLVHSEFLYFDVKVNLLVEVPHRLAHLSHDDGEFTDLINDLVVSVARVVGPENVPQVESLSSKWESIFDNVFCDSLMNLADLDVVHAPVVSEVHVLVDRAVLDVLENHVPDCVGDFNEFVVTDSPDVSTMKLHEGLMVLLKDWVHPFAHASLVVGVNNVLEGSFELSIEVCLDGLSNESAGQAVDIFRLEGWAVLVTSFFSVFPMASRDAGDKKTGGEFHIEY
jgi:hypothetical protein